MIDPPLVARIWNRFFMRGMSLQDVALCAAALVVAWNEDRTARDARLLLQALGDRLKPGFTGDALEAAQDWLKDPGFSPTQWEIMDEGLAALRREAAGPIDWTAEIAACLVNPQTIRFSQVLSLPIARSVSRLIDIPISGTCACLFSSSASVAWTLSGDRHVSLFAPDQDIAIMMALVARAACRPLAVSRRNPVDGTYMPAPFVYESPDHPPPFESFDHIISVPPFGARIGEGPSKGMPFDAYQVRRLASRASKSFSTLVPDGMLFRESRQDSELRRSIIELFAVTVVSLPPGMFWPATGISSSLLHLEPGRADAVRMIDARSMEKVSTGRAQEQLIIQHLDRFKGLEARDENRVDDVPAEEIATANFSLLPDRYLRSANLARVESALEALPVTTLADVASIERNKAPTPIRGMVEDPPLAALEIAPADIVDGEVQTPTRHVAFEKSEEPRLRNVTVEPGDILVSIKGNVGIVGIVGTEAGLAADLGERWIISQSLAVVRLKPNPHVQSADVLNAILSAPWVRERLESMSGASTVRTLPISALRSLSIPIPTAEDCARAADELKDVASMREHIDQQMKNLAAKRRALWAHLWQVPQELGED